MGKAPGSYVKRSHLQHRFDLILMRLPDRMVLICARIGADLPFADELDEYPIPGFVGAYFCGGCARNRLGEAMAQRPRLRVAEGFGEGLFAPIGIDERQGVLDRLGEHVH